MFEPFLTADGLIALVTLSAMEIVLGIDNIVFLSIITARVPIEIRPKIRSTGLALALLTRILLLLGISWVMGLTDPLFTVLSKGISGRDLILIVGGLFLLGKSTHEIFEKLEVKEEEHDEREIGGALADRQKKGLSIPLVLAQIALLDIVFSLDSVITAVGMAKDIPIMIAAMGLAMLVMLLFAGKVGEFVTKHPSMTILALSFLLMIGVMLVAEGLGQHVSKGYIYFAMAFSLGVELVNLRLRKKLRDPVKLHARHMATGEPSEAPATPPV